MGMNGQSHTTTALPPRKSLDTHCAGEPHGLSGRVRKFAPQPGLDPRPVQPVASRCTDWAILTHAKSVEGLKMICEAGGWRFAEARV